MGSEGRDRNGQGAKKLRGLLTRIGAKSRSSTLARSLLISIGLSESNQQSVTSLLIRSLLVMVNREPGKKMRHEGLLPRPVLYIACMNIFYAYC